MKVNYSKLTTKDLGALAQRVIETSKVSEISEVKNHLFLSTLEKSFNQFYNILGKQSFSGKGQSVAKADEERDKIYTDLKRFIEAYARISTLPHNADAVELLKVLNTFGSGINKLSYAEQTIQLSKLIDGISTPENTERLKYIGMETTFQNLKDAHLNFKKIFDEQAQANSELRESTPASGQRKSVEKDLKRFLDLVSLMNQTGQWTSLYLKLNEFVKATNPTETKKKTKEKGQ